MESRYLGIASLITGALSVLGIGCCCIPIISYIAMALVPILQLVSIGLGIAAVMTAGEPQDRFFGMGGAGLGLLSVLMSVAYFVLMLGVFGVIVASGQ